MHAKPFFEERWLPIWSLSVKSSIGARLTRSQEIIVNPVGLPNASELACNPNGSWLNTIRKTMLLKDIKIIRIKKYCQECWLITNGGWGLAPILAFWFRLKTNSLNNPFFSGENDQNVKELSVNFLQKRTIKEDLEVQMKLQNQQEEHKMPLLMKN